MLEALFGWRKATKCKRLIEHVRCRMKLIRSRRDTIVRQLRGDVAQLLKNGQDETALAWVEQLFKNQSILAAYDLLDHFCEFIIINLSYIRRHRDRPNDINEAVSTLIFAAARCADLPELQKLRKLFGERYGNDFAKAATELFPGNNVNQQISEKLCVRSISDDAKLGLMKEIAKDYNLKLECREIEEGCERKKYPQVHDPSVQNSNRDIQVVCSDIEGVQVQASNGKEELHLYQQRHFAHTILQGKARSDSSSNCKKTLPNPCQSHDGSDILSNSIDSYMVRKCASDIAPPLNSVAIHTSMHEVEKLDKLDPSYERIFVDLDDAGDILPSTQDYNGNKDGRWLESTNLLQRNKCRKQYEEKHAPKSRLPQSKIKIGITGSHGQGKQGNGHIYCKSPLKSSTASLLGLHHYHCAQKIEKCGELHDGSVSSRHYSNRRKSASTKSRNISISKKSEVLGDCADRHELSDLHGTGKRLSSKSHHQRDYSSLSMSLSMKDVEYIMYYDESCGYSDVDFLGFKKKTSYFHGTKPNGDYFIREHRHHSMSNSVEELCMRSELCRKKQQEIKSGNSKKHTSPKHYNAQRTSGDICRKVLVSSPTSHDCKYSRRRSCNSYSLNRDMGHECCLEHPCYFLASDDKNDWESLSPKRSCVTSIAGSPSYNIQLHEQEDHCHDLNSGINISNNSAGTIASQSRRSEKQNELKDQPSNRCDNNSSSSVSYSNEIRPPSSGSWTKTRPPYSRAMTMLLTEQPNITPTNQTPGSASLQFQKSNRHVHPKLPDYDDLAAKFMALKKEHLRKTAYLASNT